MRNPYNKPSLRLSFTAGRRAALSQFTALTVGRGEYNAWRRGFKSVEQEHAERQVVEPQSLRQD